MKQIIKLSGLQLENIVKNTSKKVLKEGIHDEVRIAHTLINEKDLNKKLEYWNTLMKLGAGEDALLDVFIWETNPEMLEIAWNYLSPKMDRSTLRFLSEPMRVKNKIIPTKAQELLNKQKANIGESKIMKQTIRLTESQLAEVIRKTVKKALKEEDESSKDRMYINYIINGLPKLSDIVKIFLEDFDVEVGTTADIIQILIRISNCSEQIKTRIYDLISDSQDYEGAYENDVVDYFNDKFKEKTGKYVGELKSILDSLL